MGMSMSLVHCNFGNSRKDSTFYFSALVLCRKIYPDSYEITLYFYNCECTNESTTVLTVVNQHETNLLRFEKLGLE